jgi:hypothetical protein
VFGNTCVHCIGALFPFHICRIGYRPTDCFGS